MAVPEVSSGIRREIVISEAAADVNGHRSVRDAVVERRSVGIAVEVNRMLFEQVRAHNLADVRQRKEELVILINDHQRRRNVAIHDANIHDWARVDMPIDARGRDSCGTGRVS